MDAFSRWIMKLTLGSLTIIIVILIGINQYFHLVNDSYDRPKISFNGHQTGPQNVFSVGQSNLTASRSLAGFLEVKADAVRRILGESPGPFLSTGSFPVFFDKMSLTEAQMLVHGKIINTPYKCAKSERLGRKGDGGYHVCVDSTFQPQRNNCLVYSFGVRDDWSFDEHINSAYGCEVHSFDPSIGKGDHVHREPNMFFHNLGIWGSNLVNDKGWKLMDLSSIIAELKHKNRIIDYLKIDAESAEWPLTSHIVKSGVHSQIRQMVLEIHTPRLISDGEEMKITDYGEVYSGLSDLEQVGFSKFLYQSNNGCCRRFVLFTPASIASKRLCCYETYYVNKAFMK